MKRLFFAVAIITAVGIATFNVQGQNAPAQPARQGGAAPAPSADPYANNAAAGTLQFPLAAPAGKDSGAITTPPAGSVNSGAFNPST